MPHGFRAIDGKPNNLRHGLCPSSEYHAWANMLQRCTNEKHPRWKQYGARGVKVCKRWLKFENFLADMGHKPSPELTLDRTDPAGNYEPKNCRWISFDENRSNRRAQYRITEAERERRRRFARERLGARVA